jgi:hypothetical protein
LTVEVVVLKFHAGLPLIATIPERSNSVVTIALEQVRSCGGLVSVLERGKVG